MYVKRELSEITGYRVGDRDSIPDRVFYFSTTCVKTGCGVHPPSADGISAYLNDSDVVHPFHHKS